MSVDMVVASNRNHGSHPKTTLYKVLWSRASGAMNHACSRVVQRRRTAELYKLASFSWCIRRSPATLKGVLCSEVHAASAWVLLGELRLSCNSEDSLYGNLKSAPQQQLSSTKTEGIYPQPKLR